MKGIFIMSASKKAGQCAAVIVALSFLGGCGYRQPPQEPSCGGSIAFVNGYGTTVQPIPKPVAAPVKPVYKKKRKRVKTVAARPARKTVRRAAAKPAAPRQVVNPPIPLPLEPVQPVGLDQVTTHDIPDRLQ